MPFLSILAVPFSNIDHLFLTSVMLDILKRKPEMIVEYTDPLEGFKGWLVIDSLSHELCAGGFRVQEGLTLDCVADLARNMTLKMRIAGIRADGAKCGIDYDPHSPGKRQAICRFMRSIRPYILERYSVGPDINIKMEELGDIAHELGIPSVKIAIAKAQGLDLPCFLERFGVLENPVDHVSLGRIRSGFGLAAACLGVLEFLEVAPQEATVAIQGFGALGTGAAYSLNKSGVRIVGLADEEKSLISSNENRLDIKALIRDSTDGLIPKTQGNGRYEDRSYIYDVRCDVLIPAAIENAIVLDNAGAISVKAVVPGANLAITQEAERLLHERDIIAIPDFVAGCGGSLSMDGLFGPSYYPSAKDVLDHVEKRMRTIVKKILERSQEDSITPREAALNLCSEVSVYPNSKPYGPLDNKAES